MEIGDRFFKGSNITGGLYCGGPPRQRHDREKYAIFTIGRKLAPAGIAASFPRKWPLFRVALSWLSNFPPFFPLGPIGAGASDDGHWVE